MGSYDFKKDVVCAWVRDCFTPQATVLDVGACDGKWRELLPEYKNMDAIEIFRPYAEKLTGYRSVITGDIFDYWFEWYDLIIFGDVIEHMSVEKAQAVLRYAQDRCFDLIVAVPYEYPQDEVDGNQWQKHLQPDLTPEIFAERYPELEVLVRDEEHKYCYYHKAR